MRKSRKSLVVLGLAVGVLSLTAATCNVTVEPSGTPSGKTPVIFVHGYQESPSMWSAAVTAFEAAGYTAGDITEFGYDTTQAASVVSPLLAAEVTHLEQFTGKPKVDIVSHSFGSMVSRYCIELGGCQGQVARWMSLAGADNGTSIANLCGDNSCKDMNGSTGTIASLQAAWGQMATQGVVVEVQWSPNDGVIIPATSSEEPAPATNVEVSGSLNHLSIPSDPGVLAETIRFLSA